MQTGAYIYVQAFLTALDVSKTEFSCDMGGKPNRLSVAVT